mgnify:CR=1 FL=1
MENQVTSIKQSKRLIELGVPADRASMVWEMDEDCARLKIWNTDEETRRILHNKYSYYYVPAFTVANLMGLIPAEITYGRLYVSHPKIPSVKNDFNVFYKRVGREKGAIKSFRSPNLTWACAMMAEWLLSNGYKLNL